MRQFFLTIILGTILSVNSSMAEDTLKVKETAKLMLDAFVKEDFNILMDYTYPKVISMGGGKEKMKVLIKNGMNEITRHYLHKYFIRGSQ